MGGVVILGAGLSGLGCARAIPEAEVFEAAADPGGHCRSHCLDGIYFDQGAHICHTNDPAMLGWIESTCPVEVPVTAASVVKNYDEGRWITYPVQNHLVDLPSPDRAAALGDFVRAQLDRPDTEPANYEEWCLRQYGDYLTRRYYARYTAKYWRTPMRDMAIDWLPGRLVPPDVGTIVAGAFESKDELQTKFAQFRYPVERGFFALFEGMYKPLKIHYGQRAVEIDAARQFVSFAPEGRVHYDFLPSSIPLPDLVAMIKDVPADIRDAAATLQSTQLLCVNLVLDQPELTPCHWFYIYDPGIEASRVSVPTNLAPTNRPVTALQAEIFRRQDEPLPADSLVEKTVSDMGRIFSMDIRDKLRAVGHQSVRNAYVVPTLRRAAAVDTILEWCEERNIYPMGLYGQWKFVWSDQAFRSGMQIADQIRKKLC